MSHETFDLIDRLRAAGRRAAMATLVRTKGATPRKEGTKMFVAAEGEIFGSVTIGGCVDARVLEQSDEILSASSPRLLSLDLGDEEAWEIGLTCGGTVDVFLEPLDDETMRLYELARHEWDAGRSSAVATVVGAGDPTLIGTHVFVGVSLGPRASRPPLPPEVIDLITSESSSLLRSSGTSRTISRQIGDESIDLYIEILRPPSTLVVFGAGAVAIPLVTLASTLGFRTIVVDARPRFANRERFPHAGEIRVGIVSSIANELALGPTTPVVLVAHDYKIDVPVLMRALGSDVPYIGLLGSRRRGAAILEMLRDQGATDEQLARVRVPIGLDLGGETAAEIALSIIAEVVAATHGRGGAPLSARAAEPKQGS